MADFNNITGGLNIPTQIPLDVKTVSLTESALASLGTGNNKAFTYYDGLKVFCLDTRKTYEWREKQIDDGHGLLFLDFTYPNNTICFGITYSNKIFNFFEIPSVLPSDIKDIVSPNNTVNITETPTQIQLNVDVNITAGANVTVTEPTPNNFVIAATNTNTIVVLQDGATTDVVGDGVATPYSVEVLNLQKVITADYTLTSADNHYTIFVNNGTSDIIVTVPSGLPSAFYCSIVRKGTGEVTITPSSTTINNPIGLRIDLRYDVVVIEQEGATNTFFLFGNTKV